MSHFFPLLLWNSELIYESAIVSLPIRYDSFWYAVALLSSDVFFDKGGFMLIQYCGHKRTRIVFYWSAGGVYWSAVAFKYPLVTITGLLCRLLIRCVIYWSAGVNYYWSAKKKSKQNQKRSQAQKICFARSSRYNYPTFYEKKISHFTMPLRTCNININMRKTFLRKKCAIMQIMQKYLLIGFNKHKLNIFFCKALFSALAII